MFEILSLAALFIFLGAPLVFANVAEAQREKDQSGTIWAAISYGILIAIYMLLLIAGVALGSLASVTQSNPDLLQQAQVNGQANPLQAMQNPILLGVGVALSSLLGLLLLLPPVRQLLTLFTKIDARSSVHAVALSLSMLVVIQIAALLGVGMENLVEMTSQNQSSSAMQLIALWAQQLFTAAFGIVGVGYLVRRNWGETMARLGLVIPSLRQVALAIGATILLLIMVVVLGTVAEQFNFGFDENVEKLSEQLMGVLFESPWGILTAGLSAAIGEEILLRGALQPRFGIILTTLIFALLHSQYGLTLSTLIVFLVGLILGVIRQRENTSTSMIVHALYNMALSTMTYLGIEFLNQ